ncbi:MarR family winged helix-turn-helix transcriptional regulator [Cucumibacter marinus]|uniref:MarR family winged helix-turn-helix transcriptional regulator n=1 Tax=Cucumibacter marinus TaxID=1121252 RepID=UPI00056D2076|nr:MarR family winged helix-turn-helix transcriptional regulator [Cucumibacter marinus]
MSDEFAECLVLNTRMAARAITRRYDQKARRFGLTAAQFSIMGNLMRNADRSVTELADDMAMERTTLSRNLDLLERKGWVASRSIRKGNERQCVPTEAGRAMVERLTPEWRKAQAEMRELLGAEEMERLLGMLGKLARL